MKLSNIGELPKFFDRYIQLNDKDDDIMENLIKYTPKYVLPSIDILNNIGEKIYAPDKWTIKDILQHCIDTERIMSYRALCFARNEQQELPGFDENTYANHTTAGKRTIEDLVDEFETVRQSSIGLFNSMSDEMLLKKGNANGSDISPLSLGFVIVGHLLHHNHVIKERYLPLLS